MKWRVIVLIAHLACAYVSLEADETMKKIFFFDFHGVLVNYDIPRLLSFIRHSIFKDTRHAAKSIAAWTRLGYHLLTRCKRSFGSSSERCIIEYAEKHPLDAWIFDDFMEVANFQKINQDLSLIVDELKKQGVIVALASNIGARTFRRAQEENTELAKLFKKLDFLVFAEPEEIEGHAVYVSKPHPLFFHKMKEKAQEYLRAHYPDVSEVRLYLVDDSRKNCDEALRQGFTAHLFKNVKSFEKCLECLLVEKP